ncbi:hypothetical protein AB6D76_23605 [Vibrio splendidus]
MANKKEHANANSVKTCFVIMPISGQTGYDSTHFTYVYEDIIKPAIELAGMVPVRADETVNTNLIQLDILRKVIESDIAICDMSSKNPNVFYELGVRQAFDKPTVLMIDDATDAPFDVSSLRYVNYKKEMGYRDVKSAITRLKETLLETFEKKDDKSEINSLIRLMELTTPAQLSQMDISAEDRTSIQISELTAAVHNIQSTQKKFLSSINQQSKTEHFKSEQESQLRMLSKMRKGWTIPDVSSEKQKYVSED